MQGFCILGLTMWKSQDSRKPKGRCYYTSYNDMFTYFYAGFGRIGRLVCTFNIGQPWLGLFCRPVYRRGVPGPLGFKGFHRGMITHIHVYIYCSSCVWLSPERTSRWWHTMIHLLTQRYAVHFAKSYNDATSLRTYMFPTTVCSIHAEI